MKETNETNVNYNIDDLIARYLTDHNDTEAIAALKKEAESSVDKREYIRKQVEIWLSSSVCASKPIFDKEAAYKRFLKNTKSDTDIQTYKPLRKRYIAIVAAVITAMAFLPWIGYNFATNNICNKVADMSIITPRGSITEICLHDGSRMWLNAGSHVTCSQGFGISNRNLRLVGEACFDVAHNENMPFVVNSHTAQVKVLGTKFNIRDYPSDKKMTIDLIRGSVNLTALKTGKNELMHPNERIIIDKHTGEMVKHNIDANLSVAWIQGEQFFDETNMEEIANSLERAYNVEIKVMPNLKKSRFYCAFNTKDYELEDVLQMLSKTQHIKYYKKDDYYVIY